MKKIVMSLLVIAVVASVAVVGFSGAWFTDKESTADVAGSPGANQLVAGSIDLDPIGGVITIVDLKPCVTQWGYITLHNAGENDGNAWLHITNVMNAENEITEPEMEAYLERSGYDPHALRYDNDLERFITVDLYIDSDLDGVASDGTWIITQDDHWKLADLECQWIPIGLLEVCVEYELWFSFHIQDEAGNQYQTDEVTFDIEVLLQQTNAPAPDNQWPSDMRVLRLENKDADWAPIDDGKYGILNYDCTHNPFVYTFEGYGLNDVSYDLIYYADPWPGDGMNGLTGVLIDRGTASGGRLSLSGNHNLGTALPNADDWNSPDGAKIWLVLTGDFYDADGNFFGGGAWNPDDYLFEMRLITYQ